MPARRSATACSAGRAAPGAARRLAKRFHQGKLVTASAIAARGHPPRSGAALEPCRGRMRRCATTHGQDDGEQRAARKRSARRTPARTRGWLPPGRRAASPLPRETPARCFRHGFAASSAPGRRRQWQSARKRKDKAGWTVAHATRRAAGPADGGTIQSFCGSGCSKLVVVALARLQRPRSSSLASKRARSTA